MNSRSRHALSASILLTFAGLALGSSKKPAGDPYAGVPQAEKDFCVAVEASTKKYKEAKAAGQNQLQLSKIRVERKAALQQALGNGSVTGCG